MQAESIALLLTLLVEAPLVYGTTRSWSLGRMRRLACMVLPSCFTHPLAWHAIGNFGAHDYVQGLLWVEGLVWIAEALLLQGLGRAPARAAWATSALANTASTLAGWVLV